MIANKVITGDSLYPDNVCPEEAKLIGGKGARKDVADVQNPDAIQRSESFRLLRLHIDFFPVLPLIRIGDLIEKPVWCVTNGMESR
tara:strand:- start:126 stop:383 length:258 start_codon:yes stop_codon:yes gene_type:complete